MRASSNHDAHFVSPTQRASKRSFKSLRAPAFGLGLMKSKEISLLGISPSSSVLHAVEGSQSCSPLQPNKSALKRDILARRGAAQSPYGNKQLVSAAPGEWRRATRSNVSYSRTHRWRREKTIQAKCNDKKKVDRNKIPSGSFRGA